MVNRILIKSFLKLATKEQLEQGLLEVIDSIEVSMWNPDRCIDNLINIISGAAPSIDKKFVINTLIKHPKMLVYEDEKLDNTSIKITGFNKITEQITVEYKRAGNKYTSTSTLDLPYIMQKAQETETES